MNEYRTLDYYTFLAVCSVCGDSCEKREKMSLEQWTVGGRGFGTLFVFLLLAGENYTTFTFLGASGYTYGKGAPAFYILGYGCLAFVMSYWMLPAVWKYAKEHKLLSFPDFFASKYKSPALGILVSIVAVLGLNSLLMIQLKGLGIIVSETSYGLISPSMAMWIGVLAMIVYVTISGIHGSASIAAFKDVIILGIALFLGITCPFTITAVLNPCSKRLMQQNQNSSLSLLKDKVYPGFSLPSWS